MIDLNKNDFHIAFAVQKIFSTKDKPKPIDDPNYVEWVALLQDLERETVTFTMINLHKCDEKDFASFYDAADSMK